jgi:hypothetical protein
MTESYIPRSIKGMRSNLYTTVILVTGNELDAILERMDELNRTLKIGDEEELRATLYNTLYTQMAKNYLGEAPSRRDFDKMKYGTIAALLLGVNLTGIDIDFKVNWEIKDIQAKNKVSSSEIFDYANYLARNYAILNKIRKDGGKYPFKFQRYNKDYYWIPLEFTL